MLIAIHPPANNDRGPAGIAQLLDALHETLPNRTTLSLELGSIAGEVTLLCRVPTTQRKAITEPLLDAYPGTTVEVLAVDPLTIPDDHVTVTTSLRLVPDVYSLRTLAAFEDHLGRRLDDPLLGVLSQLRSGRDGNLRVHTSLSLSVAPERTCRRADRVAVVLSRRFYLPQLRSAYERRATSPSIAHRLQAAVLARLSRPSAKSDSHPVEKLAAHLFTAQLTVTVAAPATARGRAVSRLRDLVGAFGRFTSRQTSFETTERAQRASFLLSAAEAAALWHLPLDASSVARLDRRDSSEREPPVRLPTKEKEAGVTLLGRVKYRNQREQFGLRLDDRRRHVHVIGKTGMGKSTLLETMLADDLASGRGVAVIDPHGDLATSLLDAVPRSRTNDVVLFDPADRSHAVAFNPLQVPPGGDPVLVAEGVLSAFEKVFGLDPVHTPRLLHILRNCLLTLVETPDATLVSLGDLLTDGRYRQRITSGVRNPAVAAFWHTEFNRWKPADQVAFVASLQNKLGAFLSNPRLRAILGQSDSRVRLRSIMDDGQILVVNLSKGNVGESAAGLLGSLLVSSLQQAAMSRSNVPEADRSDFGIVVDEFQTYSTPAFATFLSESRKYRVHLVLSHQYLAQLDDVTRDAVTGNVGSLVAFQVGADDAESVAAQLGSEVSPENVLRLPKYQAYVRLLIDGMPTRPFSMVTLPPRRYRPRRSDIIRRVSRQRFSRPVAL